MPNKVIFDKKNILIIGGAGFLGSHLCDELIKNNKVICLDNFSTGDEKNIDHLLSESDFEFIRHDITEPIDLESLPELQKFKIEFQGIQEIYNLACPTSPRHFKENRISTILANSHGTFNSLLLARKYQSKFLHFSSSVVYGYDSESEKKVLESDPGRVDMISDRSSYDEGKRFAETMVVNYAKDFDIDAKIIRLFRVYGPRMKLNDDQMLPDFIGDALEGKDLTIFGDEKFSTSLCYVSDCVDAVVKIMDSDLKGPINIGSDVSVNLTNLANKIIALVGSKSKVKYSDEILFMKPLRLPDITQARNKLGWMPVISLDKGLEKTIYELRASKGLKDISNAM